MPETATQWTTEQVRSLGDVRTLIRSAWTDPGEAAPEQRLQELLESEASRTAPRVMYVQELERAIEDGAAPAPPEDSGPGPSQIHTYATLDLVPWPELNPRKRFDAEALRELAASLKQDGMKLPLLVHDTGNREKWVVAGERRWRAAQLAGLTEVPVIIATYTLEEALRVALLENIQRADLSPVEEAEGFRRYLEESGQRQTDLAREIGRTQGYISNRLRLLRLPSEILDLIGDGALSHTHARDLILPFAQMPEEPYLALCRAVAKVLQDELDDSDGDPLDELEVRAAVVSAGGPLSRPVDGGAWIWSVDEKLRKIVGYQLPRELKQVHHKECPCNAPGFYWFGGRQGSKVVRCFDPTWWEKAAKKLRKEQKERERSALHDPETGGDSEGPDAPSAPLFEWPDRSKPVPRALLEEQECGVREVLTYAGDLRAHAISPEHAPRDRLYWIEGVDGDEGPVLGIVYRKAREVVWDITQEAVETARDDLDARISAIAEAAREQALQAVKEPTTLDGLLGALPWILWMEHFDILVAAEELGIEGLDDGSGGSWNDIEGWMRWAADHPESVQRVARYAAEYCRALPRGARHRAGEEQRADYRLRWQKLIPSPAGTDGPEEA